MRKHSSLRRVLSLVLAMALCLSLLPWTVLAADADQATATLVTDAGSLAVGDKVVIVASGSDHALSTNQKSNNRGAVAVTKSGSTVALNAEVQVLTLEAGTQEGTFAFYTGEGYLYAAGTSKAQNGSKNNNYLRTETNLSDNASWAVTIDSDGVASVIAQGENGCNIMQYNSGSTLFAAYSANQQSISIYKVDGTSSGTPETPDFVVAASGEVAVGNTLTFSTTPAVEGVVYSVKLDAGDWTAIAGSTYVVPESEAGSHTLYVRAEAGGKASTNTLELTYTVEGPSADGTVWTKVELADIQSSDTVAITMTKGDTTWVLPNVGEGNKNQPLASYTGTIAGDALTTDSAEVYSWNIVAAEGGYYIMAGGNYLYVTADNNGVRIGGTAAVWNVAEGYLASPDSKGDTRYLGVYNSQDWRCYKNTTGNTAGQTLGFWKLGAGEPEISEPTLTGTLTHLDKVYIYYPNGGLALSDTPSGSRLTGIAGTVTEGKLTVEEGMVELVVAVDENGCYSFVTAEGKYLTSGATGNSLSFADGASEYSLWTLEQEENGWFIKSVNAAYNGNAQYMEYYNGFTTYGKNSSANVALYTYQFYKSGVAEAVPGGSQGEDPQPDPIVIESGEYVIWDTVNRKALSSVRSYEGSYYYNGVDVTETDGVLSGYGVTEIWTVTVTDGKLTITCGEEKLGMSGSYGSISNAGGDTDWVLEDAGNGAYYVKNTVSGKYIAYSTSYGTWSSSTSVSGASVLKFTPPQETSDPATGVADGDYVIWAPAYNMALSTVYGGHYNNGVALTVDADRIYGYANTEIWTVTNNDDGTITISCAGGKLAMGTGFSSMPLNEVNDTWVLEDAGNGLWYVKNVGRGCYIEWYAANKYWSGYAYINEGTEGMFALKFTPVERGYETDGSLVEDIAQWAGNHTEGDENLLYATGDRYETGDHLDTDAILTIMANGQTVSPYYKPGDNWYMGGNNVGAKEGDYVQLAFSTAGWGDMELSFRIRATNAGPGSFQVQYSADGGNTFHNFTSGSYSYSYTGWNSEGSYPVTGEGTITDGIARTSLVPGEYITFTFDVPGGAENCGELLIRLVPGTERANGASGAVGGNIRLDSVAVSGSPIVDGSVTGYVTVTPNGEDEDQPVGTELTMTSGTEGATIYYRVNGGQWQVYDPANKPTLDTLPCNLEAYAVSEGKADSVVLVYSYAAGTVENVKFTPNGGGVYISGGSAEITLSSKTEGATIWYATSADGVAFTDYAVYTGPIVVEKGFEQLVVKAYAEKEGYNTSSVVTRTFTERETSTYNIYFGQLHSHTNISDGAGSVSDAFGYASGVKGLDFLAVTDHSNSFDGADSGVLGEDGTSVSTEWKEGHEAAAAVTDGDFVGLYGFEMTWSNGLGHLNTFNTPGWQSRTQSDYTSFATALQNYYETLKTVPSSISQFNHPGTTFGDFSDFAHYDEEIDQLITLIEVGNGEGAIGSSGYFPSYEYYTRALDKGWHVAPTNNQDNHKGLWGDSNTGRSVILADELTEEGIYDALRNYRVYATEDNDLNIYYTLDGNIMGSILDTSDVGETLTLAVALSDATDAAIGTVEVIVNGGLSIVKDTVTGAEESVTFSVPADYNYYYIKITQPDGDIAVTAPVWVGTVEAMGIASLEAETQLTIAGEAQNFTLELYNNEKKALEVTSVVFTDKAAGEVIYTDTTITAVPKLGTASCSFGYTFAADGIYTITATVKGIYDGAEKTYTKDLELTVMPRNITSNVIVDGTHFNDYVTGYYGGNTGNMTTIAAGQGIQVHVEKEKITAEMLADCSLLIISAPAKKTGTANAGDYVASSFEDEFLTLVSDYVKAGGNVIVCGLADYQDRGASLGAEGHTAAQINKLLAAIGSTMSINDDEAYDEVSNGGQAYRLYPEVFNTESEWMAGIQEGQTYSQYSGCTVNVGQGTWLVKGFDTTYSIDSDGDGIGGVGMGEAVFLAAEDTPYGGTIFAAGGVFVSDFEVKAELDNIWDLPYANRTVYENILNITRSQPTVTPIADVRKAETGRIFVIEGYVTAGTANPDTTFFDAIYVQDETGGITVFPYSAAGLEIGTKLRITGYTDAYQGDKEIQILSYQILEGTNVIEPEKLGNKDAMDYETNGGELIQVEGEVVEVLLTSDGKGVAQFVVKDENGDLAKVFIDGYILSGTTGENTLASIVRVGNTVSAVGLLYMHPEGDAQEPVAVLRVRDCDEILLVKEGEPVEDPEDPTDPTEPTEPSDPTEPSEPAQPEDPTNPDSGDGFRIVMWGNLLVISLLALAVLVVGRKKWSAE